MDKDLFIKIVQRYPDSSADEAREVLTLKENFPYSQLLHALSARLTKEHGFSNQGSELQSAAVYAADRSVLKRVMSESMALDDRITEPVATPVSASAPPVVQATPTAVPTVSDGEDLAETVIHDLERLHELKHHFEELFIDSPSPAPVSTVYTEPEVTTPVDETEESSSEETEASKPETPHLTGKSRKARIVELARAMQAKDEANHEPENDAAPQPKHKAPRRKKESAGDELIEEIESSKELIAPDNDKQKEQIELIDQFIKTQPSITQARDKVLPPSSGDLSTIKTGEFGDNVVSETLVEILIKQGKKDKAIEVLKKLIWKFPQKKTYFAAQIEELKK